MQEYHPKPYLLDGYKFDLRLYVLVNYCDPLRVMIFRDGLVRLSTAPYEAPAAGNLDVVTMHLTNYSINKFSETFVPSDEEGTVGSKRSYKWLLQTLAAQGHDVPKLQRRIHDAIIKTLIAGLPEICQAYDTIKRKAHPGANLNNSFNGGASSTKTTDVNTDQKEAKVSSATETATGGEEEAGTEAFRRAAASFCRKAPVPSMCFEVLGFDILLTHKLKPLVLEVNRGPSLTCDAALDTAIKHDVLYDALRLQRFKRSDRSRAEKATRRDARDRLFGAEALGKASAPVAAASSPVGAAAVKSQRKKPQPPQDRCGSDRGAEPHPTPPTNAYQAWHAAQCAFEAKAQGGYSLIYPCADPAKTAEYDHLIKRAFQAFTKAVGAHVEPTAVDVTSAAAMTPSTTTAAANASTSVDSSSKAQVKRVDQRARRAPQAPVSSGATFATSVLHSKEEKTDQKVMHLPQLNFSAPPPDVQELEALLRASQALLSPATASTLAAKSSSWGSDSWPSTSHNRPLVLPELMKLRLGDDYDDDDDEADDLGGLQSSVDGNVMNSSSGSSVSMYSAASGSRPAHSHSSSDVHEAFVVGGGLQVKIRPKTPLQPPPPPVSDEVKRAIDSLSLWLAPVPEYEGDPQSWLTANAKIRRRSAWCVTDIRGSWPAAKSHLSQYWFQRNTPQDRRQLLAETHAKILEQCGQAWRPKAFDGTAEARLVGRIFERVRHGSGQGLWMSFGATEESWPAMAPLLGLPLVEAGHQHLALTVVQVFKEAVLAAFCLYLARIGSMDTVFASSSEDDGRAATGGLTVGSSDINSNSSSSNMTSSRCSGRTRNTFSLSEPGAAASAGQNGKNCHSASGDDRKRRVAPNHVRGQAGAHSAPALSQDKAVHPWQRPTRRALNMQVLTLHTVKGQ